MKRKILVIIFILSLSAAAKSHSLGLGVQANFSAGEIFAPGAALLISPSDITHLAINWYLDFDAVTIFGLTFDACPLTIQLAGFKVGSLNFTLGIGLFANLIFADDTVFNAGLRIPVGLNIFLGPNRFFEIFTHIAPSFGVDFVPSMGLSNPFFPIALGGRIWFH